jgi:hypothetical protein
MLNEFEAQVLADLKVLKTQMAALVGDGNTGRIGRLELRVERQEMTWQKAKGFAAALGALFTLAQVALETWHRH